MAVRDGALHRLASRFNRNFLDQEIDKAADPCRHVSMAEENGKDVVVTSALWHMEAAVMNAIKDVKAGKFMASDYREWTMMAKGGASLAPYYEFDSQISADVKAKVAKLQSEIMSGSFTVEINDEEPKSTF